MVEPTELTELKKNVSHFRQTLWPPRQVLIHVRQRQHVLIIHSRAVHVQNAQQTRSLSVFWTLFSTSSCHVVLQTFLQGSLQFQHGE